MYVLRSTASNPQSGYDMLKDIESKTDGKWVPSKGMIYPLLDEMEEKGLIEIQEIGERSKKIYRITEKGLKKLEAIKEKHKEIQKNMETFRTLFMETLMPQQEREFAELFHMLRKKMIESPDRKKVKKVLQNALEELS